MYLEILTPEKKLFQGEVNSVKLPGVSGAFELLENHAPIISALGEGVIELKQGNNITRVTIEDGFIECLNNKVVVLVGNGAVA
jgi:F-type H+-transporting ATPase subunit epsilon